MMCGCACRSVTVRRLRLEHSARLSEIVRDVVGGCIRPQTFVNDGHGGRDDSMNGCGCEFDLRVGCKTTYGVIYIHTLIYYVHREIDICTDTYIHRERERWMAMERLQYIKSAGSHTCPYSVPEWM